MQLKRAILTAPLLIVLAAGCGDDSTGPDDGGPGSGPETPGSLSFTFSGPISGTFSANGVPKEDFEKSLATGSFAVAYTVEGIGMGVSAYQRTTGSRGNMVLVIIEGTDKGKYDLDPSECEPRCATVMFYYNIDFEKGMDESTRLFALGLGEVEVTEVDSKVLKGKFSGKAVEFLTDVSVLEVTNGSFSAPIVTVPPQGPKT